MQSRRLLSVAVTFAFMVTGVAGIIGANPVVHAEGDNPSGSEPTSSSSGDVADDQDIFPAFLIVRTSDPDTPRIHPQAGFNLSIERQITHIKREIVNETERSIANGQNPEENERISQMRQDLNFLRESFVREREGHRTELIRHDFESRKRGHQGFMNFIHHNPQVRATVIGTNETMGRVYVIAWDQEAIDTISGHPNVGTVERYRVDINHAKLKYAGPSVGLPAVHQYGIKGRTAGGTSIQVGVLDDSVLGSHAYLTEVYQADYAPANTGGTGLNSNNGGHGTLVAGVLNSDHSDQTGAAPLAAIRDIQVAACCFDGISRSSSDALEDGLADLASSGTDLAVHSYGGSTHGGYNSPSIKAIDYYSWYYNILVSLPTGNERTDVASPCTAYNSICVGGINDNDDRKRSYDRPWETYSCTMGFVDTHCRVNGGTNFGPSSDGRAKPDVSAPADTIKTTDRGSTTQLKIVSGTSFSAPMVAGIGALLLGNEPTLTDIEIKAIIIETAEDRPQEGGWHHDWGWGYVHAPAAINIAEAGTYGTILIDHSQRKTVGPSLRWYEAGDMASGTIVWKRHGTSTACCSVASPSNIPEIHLELQDSGGNIIQASRDTDDNVQHVSTTIQTSGWYSWKAYADNVPSSAGTTRVAFAMDPNKDLFSHGCSYAGPPSDPTGDAESFCDENTDQGEVMPMDADSEQVEYVGADAETETAFLDQYFTPASTASACDHSMGTDLGYYVVVDTCSGLYQVWFEQNGCDGLQKREQDGCEGPDRQIL